MILYLQNYHLPGIYGLQFQLASNFVHNARNISVEFGTYRIVKGRMIC